MTAKYKCFTVWFWLRFDTSYECGRADAQEHFENLEVTGVRSLNTFLLS